MTTSNIVDYLFLVLMGQWLGSWLKTTNRIRPLPSNVSVLWGTRS